MIGGGTPSQATMPYVPPHLRSQATSESAPAPSSPFGHQSRSDQSEMPSAFASSKRRGDDPHANPSAFAWGKPRESRDVVPLEPTKLAPVASAANPTVISAGGDGGPTFEIYANGAMSATDPIAVQPQLKSSGYVPPSQRATQAAAPKTYDELFPSLGGTSVLAPSTAPMKFNAPSSAGRSWAAIAQDDSLRLEAIRKQEEEQLAKGSIKLSLDNFGSTTWGDHMYDASQDQAYDTAQDYDTPHCYDYRE